jgi:mannose/cellobiose epimerase-like protein (N-acyl-D-glucosamine 2-epimerase family)
VSILESNDGRIPFRVNRRFEGIDASGGRVRLSADGCNASELFAAKALIAGGDARERESGIALFRRYLEAAFRNAYEDDTAPYGRNFHAESPFMLSFALFRYLVGPETPTSELVEWTRLADKLLSYVVDNFWEAGPRRFFELIDFETKEKQPPFIPGHACELVGLGLQGVSEIERAVADRAARSPRAEQWFKPGTFSAAKRELVQILLVAYDSGYDHLHGGMLQSVDPRTGETINNDLPWWCLTEAMRAAAYAYEASADPEFRTRLLTILTTASDDYFTNYPNPSAGLFPFRTRSGDTGEVRNFMPVVPEADPLYHTNISFIDMLAVLGRL